MADINISERQAGDVTVLDLNGKVTIGEGSVALRNAIRRLLGEGKNKILLNLGGVGYIDSSGIGELSTNRAMTAGTVSPSNGFRPASNS
jgi:anti-sigma B factor antagonist